MFRLKGVSQLRQVPGEGLLHKITTLILSAVFSVLSTVPLKEVYCEEIKRVPNVVLILCDDLGYGDVKCLNPEGKIATPQLDALAAQGMKFTDAHSGSAVCTPTRYGLMTGRYAWRTRLQSGVLGGLSPRLIEPNRETIASFLKRQGYHTACFGKWHLGLDWVKKEGKGVNELNIESAAQVNNVDYAQPYTNGPTAVGFDTYFGISASLDMVPYAFLKDDRVTVVPSASKKFPMMFGRDGGGFTRLGPATPDFEAEQVLPMLTDKAMEYVNKRAADAKKGKPFFIYMPLASPHTAIAPTKPWQDKSGLNPYADFVMETDDAIGRLLAALEKNGLMENTLVVVTSDNGCSPQADFGELLKQGHNPNYKFRGHKADIFEGGHRVPFIVRWPGQVKAGTTSDQLVCLTDLFATCADLLGAKLADDAAEDSYSFLKAMTGKSEQPPREAIVNHSINGSFAIRRGDWKLCLCADSGGWSSPRPGAPAAKDLPPQQLFHLGEDLGETKNLEAEKPEVVAELTALLERYVAEGRSTPGAPQKNAVAVNLRKGGKKPAAKTPTP